MRTRHCAKKNNPPVTAARRSGKHLVVESRPGLSSNLSSKYTEMAPAGRGRPRSCAISQQRGCSAPAGYSMRTVVHTYYTSASESECAREGRHSYRES
ncbi:uncharacterized protein LAJ45_11492 [Morchella importuna]|uniref:uncharacterized protein n=1 Tax=Morchella importuna TaxID=1174673 RepID=UPI001E8E3469|nr:uncharacterized protein LAJ45_11492 [Morchella importuna]KAH8144517.1 hypothetical protein LAJ45_11492 [Morchella importuna]